MNGDSLVDGVGRDSAGVQPLHHRASVPAAEEVQLPRVADGGDDGGNSRVGRGHGHGLRYLHERHRLQ